MGVKTAQLVAGKGHLAGARIVREGYQVMLISDAGTVIRMAVDGIKRSGRSTQGVIVTRLREGEHVSTLAPVVGSDDDDVELVKTTSDAPPAAVPGDDAAEPELFDDADEIGPVDADDEE
jgi:DNA gyrase subunit A